MPNTIIPNPKKKLLMDKITTNLADILSWHDKNVYNSISNKEMTQANKVPDQSDIIRQLQKKKVK